MALAMADSLIIPDAPHTKTIRLKVIIAVYL